MSTNKKKSIPDATPATVAEDKATEAKVSSQKPQESKYSVAELVANANVFGVPSYLVAAALKTDGKSEYTESEARETIKKFKNKEVGK